MICYPKKTKFNVMHRFMLQFYFCINNSGAQDNLLNLPVRYHFTIMFILTLACFVSNEKT